MRGNGILSAIRTLARRFEMFVRGHYEAIAAALKEARVTVSSYGPLHPPLHPIDVVEDELVKLFTVDNPRFDEVRFRAAAGSEQ
jgi:hypothetical protein